MHVIVEVSAAGAERPPLGSPIRIEARDTSYEDAPAEVVGRASGEVRGELGAWLDSVEISIERMPVVGTIWAHVDVDGDGSVSPGDFITTVAYPIPPTEGARVDIAVRRV